MLKVESLDEFCQKNMLKKSSKPVSPIPNLMAPTSNYSKPLTSPLFPLSPRAFVNFSPKGYSDFDSVSPTSILETKANPFFFEKYARKPFIEQEQARKNNYNLPIGLGIVDELKKPPKPESRMVLFGSQLKIQIPQNGIVECMKSPIEFGIKNKESQLALYLPVQKCPINLVSGCIPASEMEMSEDYTCVISHGPNPKTTHFFDNCIVESCGDGFALTPKKENVGGKGFLASCDTCKKKLGEGKDIFMYRGEKAFCSHECRYQEMLIDEEIDDSWLHNPSTTSIKH